MAEESDQIFKLQDLSLGLQRKTTRFMQRPGEANAAENTSFDELGGVGKKLGYSQEGDDLTSTTSTSTSTSTTSSSTSTSTTSTSSSSSTSRTTSTSTTTTA